MDVDAVVARHPGSEHFRDLLIAESEDELDALAADLAKRVTKVKTRHAESRPAPPKVPTGATRRADGYVEGTAKTVDEAVKRQDMQSYLKLRRAEVEAELRRQDKANGL